MTSELEGINRIREIRGKWEGRKGSGDERKGICKGRSEANQIDKRNKGKRTNKENW